MQGVRDLDLKKRTTIKWTQEQYQEEYQPGQDIAL